VPPDRPSRLPGRWKLRAGFTRSRRNDVVSPCAWAEQRGVGGVAPWLRCLRMAAKDVQPRAHDTATTAQSLVWSIVVVGANRTAGVNDGSGAAPAAEIAEFT
jgi:hypothetical protein